MKEYKIKSKYYTVDYSEVDRCCHFYIKKDTSSFTDKELEIEQNKLKRRFRDYQLDKIHIEKYYLPSELVDELQDIRNGIIRGDNRFNAHNDDTIVKDKETGEEKNILYDDHDIRFARESTESEFLQFLDRMEKDHSTHLLSEPLYKAWLTILTPQQRFIIYTSFKRINNKKFLTYEEIGEFYNKTGNAVSQNVRTILKKLTKYIEASIDKDPVIETDSHKIDPLVKLVRDIFSL